MWIDVPYWDDEAMMEMYRREWRDEVPEEIGSEEEVPVIDPATVFPPRSADRIVKEAVPLETGGFMIKYSDGTEQEIGGAGGGVGKQMGILTGDTVTRQPRTWPPPPPVAPPGGGGSAALTGVHPNNSGTNYWGNQNGYGGFPQASSIYGSRLIVPRDSDYERVMQGIKQAGAGYTADELQSALRNPTWLAQIAQGTGVSQEKIQQIASKILATGVSGILLAVTKNFPLAAMGYFALDNMFSKSGKAEFNGWMSGEATIDGFPLMPFGVEIPEGLPNEIFADYRFICYDHLTGKWFPSDEIQPLNYSGNGGYRWMCLDRVEGKVYRCNYIKKPLRIFV